MKLSKLLAASLALVAVVAGFGVPNAEAKNPAKFINQGLTLGQPYVFPAECGTDSLTQASFQAGPGIPLTARVNEVTSLTGGYAGAVVFTPVANLDLTDLSTFTSPLPQGTFSHTATVYPFTFTGDAAIDQAVAYSWVNAWGCTKYGISFVPSSFVNGTTAFTNHAIKNKSISVSLITNTTLTDLYNGGYLVNLIGCDPGKNATNFQLLGIGSGLINLGADGTYVNGVFNNFALNNVNVAKAIDPIYNINCGPFLPTNTAAAAAARAH